ncbi:hypothetical protein LCGC14_0623110 [marine sediment metagenome]|uniref:Uncharacterized protein n=1 Tax=marine sediment metagenome TaxID=412755 RepID=A0A0F9R9A5_9ZZZZ
MSYETIEAAVEKQIEAIKEFKTDQVSRGDWRILHAGTSHAAVLEYGGFRVRYESIGGGTTFFWTVTIHLFGRYTDDDVVHNILRDRRQDIVDRLLQFPQLNGTAGVIDSKPERGSWADPQLVEIGSVAFLEEIIEVVVEEHVEVTLQE